MSKLKILKFFQLLECKFQNIPYVSTFSSYRIFYTQTLPHFIHSLIALGLIVKPKTPMFVFGDRAHVKFP